jgi:hypothetical protein
VVDGRAWVHGGDRPAKLDRAVRLGVDQRLVQQALEALDVFDQLARRQRADAAFRQIELHQVLKGGLHPFHFEPFELHGGRLY